MSEKLDKLRRERDKAERHLRKAANDERPSPMRWRG